MPEETPGSVTHWIGHLKQGDAAAAQALWERYFSRLVRLARTRLRGAARPASDEEDVALSAFDSFCRGAEQGRFPDLLGRESLWQLLAVITTRKAFDLANYHRRRKRGGELPGLPRVGGEALDVERRLSREPSPEAAAEFADECRRLLDLLGDADLRFVALRKLEGHTNAEIAAQLGCVRRTVERKLEVIRSIWAEQLEP